MNLPAASGGILTQAPQPAASGGVLTQAPQPPSPSPEGEGVEGLKYKRQRSNAEGNILKRKYLRFEESNHLPYCSTSMADTIFKIGRHFRKGLGLTLWEKDRIIAKSF